MHELREDASLPAEKERSNALPRNIALQTRPIVSLGEARETPQYCRARGDPLDATAASAIAGMHRVHLDEHGGAECLDVRGIWQGLREIHAERRRQVHG